MVFIESVTPQGSLHSAASFVREQFAALRVSTAASRRRPGVDFARPSQPSTTTGLHSTTNPDADFLEWG